MAAWKRWSWRYRVGALFALALLLQGASCPLQVFERPTVYVPNVGNVVLEYFREGQGSGYFMIEEIDTNGARGFRRVDYDNWEYRYILAYFINHGNYVPGQWWGEGLRAGIPGAAGTAPAPPQF